LTGWKVHDAKADVWAVEDGLLVCRGDKGGWLGTEREYADFVLRLDYRLKPGGNSGVYLRAPETGHISRVGMEIQILDDNAPQYAKLDFYSTPARSITSSHRTSGPASRQANGTRWKSTRWAGQVVVTLNGKKIVDADLDRCLKDPAVAKEHTGLTRSAGRIGLQSHSERVEFRNLRVKEVKLQ